MVLFSKGLEVIAKIQAQHVSDAGSESSAVTDRSLVLGVSSLALVASMTQRRQNGAPRRAISKLYAQE